MRNCRTQHYLRSLALVGWEVLIDIDIDIDHATHKTDERRLSTNLDENRAERIDYPCKPGSEWRPLCGGVVDAL